MVSVGRSVRSHVCADLLSTREGSPSKGGCICTPLTPPGSATALSAFVISKTVVSGQKPRERQLNTKVCGSKSAIFLFFLLTTTMFNNDISQTVQVLTVILARNDPYHNAELYDQSASS